MKKILLLLFFAYPFIGYFTIITLGIPPTILFLPVILLIAFIIFTDNLRVNFPPYLFFFLCFILLSIFSKYIVNGISFKADVNLRNSLILITSFSTFLILENLNFKKEHLKSAIKYLKLLIVISLVTSIVQYFVPTFFVNQEGVVFEHYLDPSYSHRRIISIFSWVDNSNLLVFGIPMILNVILGWEYYNKGNIRSAYWVIGAVGLICIISRSRNFLMLYFIVVLYYLFKTFSFKIFTYYVIGISFIGLGMVYLNFDFDLYVRERLQSDSYYTRIEAVYAFLQLFPENYLWGTGGIVTNDLYNFYGRETRIHNGYLAIFYYYGLVGGIAYFGFILSFLRRYHNYFKRYYINIPLISFACLAFGNLAVDYFRLFDIGLIFTIIISNELYKKNEL